MEDSLYERYVKCTERYVTYQNLASAMRIDGHEGMAKAYQRTADNALTTLRILELQFEVSKWVHR